MKTLLLLLVTSLASAQEFEGLVVKVTDGDTVQVLINNETLKIRLAGVDCPEKKQPFGNKAKEFTKKMVIHKKVTVFVKSTDRYNRLIADVTVEGKSLNEELVKAGFAWWYKAYAKKDTKLRDLEEQARYNKVGLWSEPDPVPPWEFRRKK